MYLANLFVLCDVLYLFQEIQRQIRVLSKKPEKPIAVSNFFLYKISKQ